MASRIVTHKGYGIRKDSLSEQAVQSLKKELTVAPMSAFASRSVFAAQPTPFTLYLESPTRYYVPRQWGLKTYGPPEQMKLEEGLPLRSELSFTGTPYDYQTAIIDQFLAAGSNGLLCVPCGRGKTFMAIRIAFLLGRRFVIVVDKEFLLDQWRKELEGLLPGIRIGIVQGPKQQTDPVLYDCTIAMIQTLVQREYSDLTFQSYGCTIFDECHHLGAAQFSRALFKVQTKHMLGLSATPVRDDGLTKVFEWFLGTPVYWEKQREADPDVVVRKIPFTCESPEYTTLPQNHMGETVLARLLTQVVECEERNAKIDALLVELLKEKDRKILVLSERISHLERIEKGLPEGTSVGYYIGGMKPEVREEGAKTAVILLGTYQMASEAMNIKTLNTMVMASPRKKIEQSTGRILRVQKSERSVAPLILDIVDSHDVYKRQWLKRRTYYKTCCYKIDGEKASKKPKEEEELSLEKCLLSD
uniref:Helicase ATP-binding domain-containing protein n=1 Tax=viral metagenome TaxID=1070528 RepID=A0A6C0DQ76_9ZZZZ